MSHPTDANCIFCKIVAGQIPSFKLLELSLIHISEPTRPY